MRHAIDRQRWRVLAIVVPVVIGACRTASELPVHDATGTDREQIAAVVGGVVSALNNKSGAALQRYYMQDADRVFYGIPQAAIVRGGKEYVSALQACLALFRTVQVSPNDDLRVRTAGSIAVATLTGTNNVVELNGTPSTSRWRWTIQLERTAAGGWMIAHEHLSFL